MDNKDANRDQARTEQSPRQPGPIRLPGFLVDEEIGLGDAIKRATSAVGIKPCRGCQHRAEVLNRWVVFSGRRGR